MQPSFFYLLILKCIVSPTSNITKGGFVYYGCFIYYNIYHYKDLRSYETEETLINTHPIRKECEKTSCLLYKRQKYIHFYVRSLDGKKMYFFTWHSKQKFDLYVLDLIVYFHGNCIVFWVWKIWTGFEFKYSPSKNWNHYLYVGGTSVRLEGATLRLLCKNKRRSVAETTAYFRGNDIEVSSRDTPFGECSQRRRFLFTFWNATLPSWASKCNTPNKDLRFLIQNIK